MKQEFETEVRFLDIDEEAIKEKLLALGAEDEGRVFLEEMIFYNSELTWPEERKIVRLRKKGDKVKLAYKDFGQGGAAQAENYETKVGDMQVAAKILEKTGLVMHRKQEKWRHSFTLGDVEIVIDQWPRIPAYIEIEGTSEDDLKRAAGQLGLDWGDAFYDDAKFVLLHYGIDVMEVKNLVFDKELK